MADGFHIINGVAVFFGIPEFMWSGIFGFITTVCAGLIVGVFTSSFLKKREERIRVSGLIIEKRVEVQRQLSSLLFKRLLFDPISVNDPDVLKLLEDFDIADTHSEYQRSVVFDSAESCAAFIRQFRELFYENRIWLDERTRNQLSVIQYYLEAVAGLTSYVDRVPLPDGIELSPCERGEMRNRIIQLAGVVADNDFNAMLGILDNYIAESVHKLDMRSPRHSLKWKDHRRFIRIAMDETEFGDNFSHFIESAAVIVIDEMGLIFDSISEVYVFLDQYLDNCKDLGGALEDLSRDGALDYLSRHVPSA